MASFLPQVACIVHHGGAGTSVAAFRSGTPSFITPFNFDQFEFARVSVSEGVGPQAGPYTKLSPTSLGALIKRAVSNPLYRASAASMRERQLAEDGTAVAVRAFPQMAKRNIWQEERERRARGDKYAIRPPKFFLFWERRKSELVEPPPMDTLEQCMLEPPSSGGPSSESAEPPSCDEQAEQRRARRRLGRGDATDDAGDADDAVWVSELRDRIGCWFVGLPLPTQKGIGECMGAFSLAIGSQLGASWRAAQQTLLGGTGGGGWRSAPSQRWSRGASGCCARRRSGCRRCRETSHSISISRQYPSYSPAGSSSKASASSTGAVR